MSGNRRNSRSIGPTRTVLVVILLSTLAITSFFCYLTYIVPEEHPIEGRIFTVTMEATYTNENEAEETWNLTEDDMAIGLFMNNSWQTVYLVDSSFSIQNFKTDEDGNLLAIMNLPPSLEPGQNLSYEVTYRIILREPQIPQISEGASGTLDDISEELRDAYCKAEGTWQVNDANLRTQAYTIAGNETKVLTLVKKFISWIHETITYGSFEVPRYPNETVSGGVGDCDDQANLLITFCRIVGIPAYLQIGCIHYPGRSSETSTYWDGHFTSTLSQIGWHGWAIVLIPPWGWLPVDLTFVRSGLADPLNAIKSSAIVTDPTAQYINITRTDYAADSRNTRNFLITHDYFIYQHDSMDEESLSAAQFSRLIQHLKTILLIPVFWPSSILWSRSRTAEYLRARPAV